MRTYEADTRGDRAPGKGTLSAGNEAPLAPDLPFDKGGCDDASRDTTGGLNDVVPVCAVGGLSWDLGKVEGTERVEERVGKSNNTVAEERECQSGALAIDQTRPS
jgi:hypothetical protein